MAEGKTPSGKLIILHSDTEQELSVINFLN